MIRVYPIRKTKRSWKIPIYGYHECDESCSHIFIVDPDNINRIELSENSEYKDGKCSKNNVLQKTVINIWKYDQNDPRGNNKGKIYDSEQIVIGDAYFNMAVLYPLTTKIDVTIKSSNKKGFTMKELIQAIHNVYKFVYKEEERTASLSLFKIQETCELCINMDVKSYLKKVDDPEECKDCVICYDKYNKNMSELKCKHVFHTECIYKWLDSDNKNKKTCPLCRDNIGNCEICKNSGYICSEYIGKVLPRERRLGIINRHSTDGVFGIHSHDLEDLVIEDLEYNRIEKRLTMKVATYVI